MVLTRDRPPRLAAVLAVFAIFAWQVAPAGPGDDMAEETSSIVGKITLGMGKESVENATVIAYHLSTARTFRAAPTARNGKFAIGGLPNGYFDLAIETPDGLYVGTQVVNAPPGGKVVANMSLIPAEATGEGPREFPGSDKASVGTATAVKGGMSTKGKVALGVAGAVATWVLLSDDDEKSSPSSPTAGSSGK